MSFNKKAILILFSSMLVASLSVPIMANADETSTYPLNTAYSASDTQTYFFDENFDTDISTSAKTLRVSLDISNYDVTSGYGLKFLVNNDEDSDYFYFLTISTNSWAEAETVNHIEPEGNGTYTLEFDLSKYNSIDNIKGDLWQGTVSLNGLELLDADSKVIKSFGEIKTPTVGRFVEGKGKVSETTTKVTTTATISTTTESKSVTTSIVESKTREGFSFWYLGIPVAIIGLGLIVLAIIFTKKMK